MLMAFSDLDRLFIIGNGFDLAHGLKTSYENFRQYLLNVENIQTPGENFCPNDILQLISRCAGTARWCDIETDLGYVSGQVKKYVDETKDYDVQRLQGALLGGILEDIPKYGYPFSSALETARATQRWSKSLAPKARREKRKENSLRYESRYLEGKP